MKDEVGFRLADRLFDIKREFQVAADIGCNRGFVSRHILAENVKHLHMCEMSPTMLQQAEGTPGLQITKHEMDEEFLDVSGVSTLLFFLNKINDFFFSSLITLWTWLCLV